MHKMQHNNYKPQHQIREDLTELVFPLRQKNFFVPTFAIFLDGLFILKLHLSYVCGHSICKTTTGVQGVNR